MKKHLSILAILAMCSTSLMADDIISTSSILFSNCPQGAINGAAVFTVNDQGKQVYFAKGNLQYQASTGKWRFAEKQYEFMGNVTANTAPTDTQTEWKDLFRWATSGEQNMSEPTRFSPTFNHTIAGTQYNQHYNLSSSLDYLENASISGTSLDWGVRNPIENGGNTAGQWRTLTQSEWQYIIDHRTIDESLFYTYITVNDVVYQGILITPDNYSGPVIHKSGGYLNRIVELNEQQWNNIEVAGGLFLPSAGYISQGWYTDSRVNQFYGSVGGYWSSTGDTELSSDGDLRNVYNKAYRLIFYTNYTALGIYATSSDKRYAQFAVRLVIDK